MRSVHLALGMLAAWSMGAVAAPAEDRFINWRTDYRAALQEAKQAQKPVFLEFRCEA
jgi:hypothetical protein